MTGSGLEAAWPLCAVGSELTNGGFCKAQRLNERLKS